MDPVIIYLNEHSSFRLERGDESVSLILKDSEKAKLSTESEALLNDCSKSNKKDHIPISEVRTLGVLYDWFKNEYSMSYYIGADWLDVTNKIALVVRPKLEKESYAQIDFQKMFMDCFEDAAVSREQSMDLLFHVKTDLPYIPIKHDDFSKQLEPLLIIAFLESVKNIIRSGGLRKDYIQIEENLEGKIKGKILFPKHIKSNVAKQNGNRVYCEFQEYSVNCFDNRLLKKAILLCRKQISSHHRQLGNNASSVMQILNYCLPAFENVSEEISKQEIRKIHVNPVFKNYKSAIALAKMILDGTTNLLRRNEANLDATILVPPFIIDMSLLFERYVYHLLHRQYGDTIRFQVSAAGNRMDFCKTDERVVIDSKYIPRWKEAIDHENVRQLCGYSRLNEYRKIMNINADDDKEYPCLIVYPDLKDGINEFNQNNLVEQSTEVKEYKKVYKIGITLP